MERLTEEEFIATVLTETFVTCDGTTASRLLDLGNGYFVRVHARPRGWTPWMGDHPLALGAEESRPRRFFLKTFVKNEQGCLVPSFDDGRQEARVLGAFPSLSYGDLQADIALRAARPRHGNARVSLACDPSDLLPHAALSYTKDLFSRPAEPRCCARPTPSQPFVSCSIQELIW